MNQIMKKYIELALLEDIGTGDITTESLNLGDKTGEAVILYKEDSVVCGIPVVCEIFRQLQRDFTIDILIEEGENIQKGQQAAKISAKLETLLKGERTALNFLQRMSACAYQSRKIAGLCKNFKVVDTRKTTPNFRVFEKYAVRTGGCTNHRMGLYDCAMIKDNHIKAAGSVKKAVELVRGNIPYTARIEVEAATKEQFVEALSAGADIIMLDNMTDDLISEIALISRENIIVEVSGNISEKRLSVLSDKKIDYVSMGKLSYNYGACDISMKIL